MLVRAGEFLRVMGAAGVDAVRVAVDGDGRNGDRRLSREPHFNLIIPWIAGAGREPVTMPIGMDDDCDEVGIVEGGRRSVEGRIVERPVRRPHTPQEARDASPGPWSSRAGHARYGSSTDTRTPPPRSGSRAPSHARCSGYCTNCRRRARRPAWA